jgi:hypothetical protein
MTSWQERRDLRMSGSGTAFADDVGVVGRHATEAHIRVGYQCSPYHSDSPLYPVIQQLAFAAGITAEDNNDEFEGKAEDICSV